MKILLAALLLAGCAEPAAEKAPPHHEGVPLKENLKVANTVPLPGEMKTEQKYAGAMLAAHVQQQQDIELLYIEKIYPAVKAALDRPGLVKVENAKQILALNKGALADLGAMGRFGRAYREKGDQDNLQLWQKHHDAAYKAMGRMLELTGQLKTYEIPRKANPDDLRFAVEGAYPQRGADKRVSAPVQSPRSAGSGTAAYPIK